MRKIENNNYKKVKLILLVLLGANLIVAVSKILIGLVINSSSVMADGFHSISDSASNIIGIIGIVLASRPKDSSHPYGHKKFETIASMFIGTMLLFISFSVIKSSIYKLFNPSILEISVESLVIILLTLFINIFVAVYENKQGIKLNSQLLIADSLHTKSDIFVSSGVLITLLCIKLGFPPIVDTITSFIVSLFILHASYEIFKDNISPLTDKVILDEEIVIDILEEFDDIKDVHNIRSRGFKDYVFLDMHIKVDSNLNIDEAHSLVHKIENTLINKLGKKIDVIIHVEPNKK
ncbi:MULTISPECIES: cation diffusion facilitator family transporter [Clostridium]|jgi:cation diffusion facilitator family transporter|uniref:Cation efflux rotein n=2 Tax=root TaxID=1 RepID=R9CE13_9CLOT|nr:MULTISPECIES: cation diffusion facilitator family transporter [Clostridium]EOR27255.1 cation efflux rotein [Clostridium sartagoforme AAU1]KLE15091.1 cation transporter [Clostridium sp. C8]